MRFLDDFLHKGCKEELQILRERVEKTREEINQLKIDLFNTRQSHGTIHQELEEKLKNLAAIFSDHHEIHEQVLERLKYIGNASSY